DEAGAAAGAAQGGDGLQAPGLDLLQVDRVAAPAEEAVEPARHGRLLGLEARDPDERAGEIDQLLAIDPVQHGARRVVHGCGSLAEIGALRLVSMYGPASPRARPPIVSLGREPNPLTGEKRAMSFPSYAGVTGRSLGEPEAFGLIYDRHAPTVLRFLGRRAGAEVAEGLLGELFRIAFERRKAFDASRASALPWLYGIGANLLLKHRRGETRRLRASARMAADEAA